MGDDCLSSQTKLRNSMEILRKYIIAGVKRGWGIWKSGIGRYTTKIDDIWVNDDCEERLYKQLTRSESETDGKMIRSSFHGLRL